MLESRTDLQIRYSYPSDDTTTDVDDLKDRTAFLIVQLQKDIAVTKRPLDHALTQLNTMTPLTNVFIEGLGKILYECFMGLCLLEIGCEQILRLDFLKGRSANLMVQLQKDIASTERCLKDAWHSLEGMFNFTESIIDCVMELDVLKGACEQILRLTKRKTVAVTFEKRLSIHESEKEHLEALSQFARGKAMDPEKYKSIPRPKISDKGSPEKELKKLLERRWVVSSGFDANASAAALDRKTSSHTVTPPKNTNTIKSDNASGTPPPTIKLKNGKEHVLPMPRKDD